MEDIQKSEQWVNLKDVAGHLSTSQDAIREWIKKGKFLIAERAGHINFAYLKSIDGLWKEKSLNEQYMEMTLAEK